MGRKPRAAARARHYLAQSLHQLGTIIQELDFIGPRLLAGCAQPFYLASRYYIQPFRFGWWSRIATPSMAAARHLLVTDWRQYPKADVLTLDNVFCFTAAGKGRSFLSGLLIFLLNLDVVLLLLPPREPWSHGSVEGHNSVFARKLWQRYTFSSLDELDQATARLNAQYLALQATQVGDQHLPAAGFRRHTRSASPPHNPRGQALYFVRSVQEVNGCAGIEVLKLHIPMETAYLSQFVLTRIDLGSQRLDVFFDHDDGSSQLIHSQQLAVKFSDKRCKYSSDT